MKYSLRLRNIALASGLLSLACLAACSRKEPEAAAPPAESPAPAIATGDYGFMGQAPQDVEMYIGSYNSRKVWRRLVNSKAYAALRASHLFQHHFGPQAHVPGARDALTFFSPNGNATISNPEVLKWRHIVADALGTEFFVSFGDGAAQDIQTLQQFSKEIRIQHMKSNLSNAFNHTPQDPKWMRGAIPALAPYIETLQFPPLVLGFKMTSQKTALQEEIDGLRAKLPPGVAVASFNLGDRPFTSWTFAAGTLMPQNLQQRARNFLEANVPDKAVADGYVQALLARKIEVAFGYAGDYFLVSVGADHSHLKLAATPAESLLHRPELSVLAPYGEKDVWLATWASQKALEITSQRDFALLPLFESIKPSLAASLSPQDIEQAETDLRRIDAKGRSLLHPTTIQPAVSVSFWKDGLRCEQYGGILPAGLATDKALTMESTDLPSNFVWADSEADPAFGAAFLDWLQDIKTTAFGIYHRAILPKMNDQKRQQSAFTEALVVPKLTELYHITRDQLLKSLGAESVFALDLNGAVPPIPSIPAPVQQGGKMPRLAWIRNVQDPKLLSQSWQSYLASARQLSVMLPPKMQAPGGIPDPQSKDLGGAEMHFYPLPLSTGDLLPNVTVAGGKEFIASTSPDYASALSGALVKGGPVEASSALKFDIRMTALYDFAQAWLGLLDEHPELLRTPDAGAHFKNVEPRLLTLLKALRVFQGLEGRVYQENGQLRSSAVWHIRDVN